MQATAYTPGPRKQGSYLKGYWSSYVPTTMGCPYVLLVVYYMLSSGAIWLALPFLARGIELTS